MGFEVLRVCAKARDLESFLEVMTVELRSSSLVAADVGTFLDAFSTTSLPSLFSRWLAIWFRRFKMCFWFIIGLLVDCSVI